MTLKNLGLGVMNSTRGMSVKLSAESRCHAWSGPILVSNSKLLLIGTVHGDVYISLIALRNIKGLHTCQKVGRKNGRIIIFSSYFCIIFH